MAQRAVAHYEAARETRFRKFHRDGGHPDSLVTASAVKLRNQARFLERNHDLTRGALKTLTHNVIGANGIMVEPQPRRADGTVDETLARELARLWKNWCEAPEVTGRLNFAAAQRMMFRARVRDGEAFAQQLPGPVRGLDHGTLVPYSLELLESDFVPLDHDDPAKRIRQGVQVNAWGRATGYVVYKGHPQDPVGAMFAQTKIVPASRMIHLFTPDRLHQMRGVSEMASVITRMDDVKDYEESERIAAGLAARLGLYVKRGDAASYNHATAYDEDGNAKTREIELEAGLVFDDLRPGEEIGMVDSKRPNVNAVSWRSGQLRAAAAGWLVSYSSLARDYDGTYSAQRQELVEQYVHYAVMTDDFASQFVKPNYETFVRVAMLAGLVSVPGDVVDLTDALFIGQSMPWIDPLKEVKGWLELVQAGFGSEIEVMRRRGVNPDHNLELMKQWRGKCDAAGIVTTSNPAPAAPTVDPGVEDDDEASPTAATRGGTRTRSQKGNRQ